MAKDPQKTQERQKSVNSGSKVKAADPLLPQKALLPTNPSLRQLEGKEEDIFKPDAKALEPSAVSLSTPLNETKKSVLRGEKTAATETAEMPPAHGVVQDTPEIAPAMPNTDSTPISGNRAPMVVSSAKPQGLEQKASKEELALIREKLSKNSPERRSLLGAAPKALEGYIIQLAFTDRSEARRWADTFQHRGYAVSMTEAASGSLRVRFGNFHVRDQAEQQLQNLKQDGLTGIIVNLPQAYQPETRSLLP
jgi:cell division septation protein DedD